MSIFKKSSQAFNKNVCHLQQDSEGYLALCLVSSEDL